MVSPFDLWIFIEQRTPFTRAFEVASTQGDTQDALRPQLVGTHVPGSMRLSKSGCRYLPSSATWGFVRSVACVVESRAKKKPKRVSTTSVSRAGFVEGWVMFRGVRLVTSRALGIGLDLCQSVVCPWLCVVCSSSLFVLL